MPVFLGSQWWPLWLFPLVTALVLTAIWLFRGRDERAVLPISHPFLPPLDLSPAQIGTLVDSSCDARDISATLAGLAVRGFLRIEEIGDGDFLLKRGDLRFVKADKMPPLERLKKHERLFFEALFDSQPPDLERGRRAANWNMGQESWNEIALSLLKNKFYRHIEPIRAEIYASLVRDGYFPQSPDAQRVVFTTVRTILLGGGFFVFRADLNSGGDAFTSGLISFPLGVIISGALWYFSASYMAPKSALGTHKADAARRFAAWVKSVSHSDLRSLFAKQPAAFERLFPYAVVLGVGGIWAQKGGDCGQSPPAWFVLPDLDAEISGFPIPTAQDSLWRLGQHWNKIERVLVSMPRAAREEPENESSFFV